MSHRPSGEPERPHFFWLSLALCALTVFILIVRGQHAWAAAGLGLALAVAFFRSIRKDITTRSISYLAVGAVAYLVAWNRGVAFLYAFSAACFSIVVIAHLLPRWVLRPVQGRINAPASVLQGDTAELVITLENPARAALRMIELEIPIPGAIREGGKAASWFGRNRKETDGEGAHDVTRALIVRIGPGASERLSMQTPPLRRGCHTLGPLVVGTGFPLGLAMRSLEIAGSGRELWVYPRLFPVEFLPIAGEQFQQMGEAISPRAGGGEDFAGVREYRHGDSRRSIHWRASARHQELVVKEFMRTVATTITIAVDLARSSDVGTGVTTAAEDAIRIAGSIARYALEQRHHVQLALCGSTLERCGPVGDLADMDTILRTLARCRVDGEDSFDSHLPQVAAIVPPNSTVVLVYTDASAGELGAVEALHAAGVLVVPIVVEAQSYGEVAFRQQGQRSSRMRARRVRSGIDLATVFRQ